MGYNRDKAEFLKVNPALTEEEIEYLRDTVLAPLKKKSNEYVITTTPVYKEKCGGCKECNDEEGDVLLEDFKNSLNKLIEKISSFIDVIWCELNNDECLDIVNEIDDFTNKYDDILNDS